MLEANKSGASDGESELLSLSAPNTPHSSCLGVSDLRLWLEERVEMEEVEVAVVAEPRPYLG